MKPVLTLRKATWNDDELPNQIKRGKRKACRYDKYNNNGICEPSKELNPVELSQWRNELYNEVLSIKSHRGYVNLPEGEEITVLINLWKEFFTDKMLEGIRTIINKYAQ